MSFAVKITDWATDGARLADIRHEVFVIEQQVPLDMELDEYDETAIHAIALNDKDEVIGTGRLLSSGKIGRMAVLKSFRNQGVGAAMLKLLTQTSLQKLEKAPYLEAQIHAIPFYERHGYEAEGEVYLDAGIEHRLMRFRRPVSSHL